MMDGGVGGTLQAWGTWDKASVQERVPINPDNWALVWDGVTENSIQF